jgi:thiol:disulfide interchange protein
MLMIVLLVALLIAWFAVTQMGSFGFGKTNTQTEQTQQNVIEQAQNAVDAIKNHLEHAQELEP